MEKQEFCMEKSQIFQEMISRISKLSQDSYLMVTDMQHNLTFVPESTAEFLGIPSGWCEDGYKIVLEKSVHPYDCPEYTEEMKKRLRGINLENDLYIRMGKDKKYVMTQIITDMILEQGKNRYFIVLLRNQNVIPEIDPLTDLYGQVKFEKDIVDYIQQGRKVAVLEIEIDHMNDINILYGTNYSDRIQKVLAYRFIYMMDADKAVYRMGNSNYAFILRDASREEATAFLEKIRARLEESVVLENNHFDLKIYASGIILDHYEGEISTVQSKLEYILGKMRTRRDHKLMFFNDLVQINGDVDLDLMKVIHQSVLNQCDGFYVEYQPVVHAQTGEIAGAEALVRWKKEPYGIVPPGMFIDWLESNPCMYDLGNFVLKQALTDAVEFRKSNPDFFINVNMSAKQLERKTFCGVVMALLKETGFPAGQLCLELTERCRSMPVSVMGEKLLYLKQHGVRLAMDDYGTGSASSSVLLQTPMDEIKIDMSFIRGITDNQTKQALVRSMVDFANEADLKSCLEGVEDEKLQNYLRSFGATWFQGYYYSRPVQAAAMKKLLNMEN
ncbi:MAG: bifunctional diguanylate cyclase/phosphodiesterase [Roseburia faecis]|uniref:EAL domain-containing protein n=1 Tax=Roseburia faecis TaxID=301302 RepID=UPI001B2EC407|nr:GGDEF domain-containing protein [Agathobacter sp.]MCI6684823.1 bifunctional diguanylate cyclase/phosphodiesterase [Roseburia faecis]MDY4478173.1 bifunctional diguanylate cyclase/phosphodiesterase [Roseburia faecis]MDY6280373.1 bifunctional diguanylate cyclase/phosphodiesterase [Roseburia faecis]